MTRNACEGINPEAVPDLLAAAQMALDGLNDGWTTEDFERGKDKPARDALAAAIAKATDNA